MAGMFVSTFTFYYFPFIFLIYTFDFLLFGQTFRSDRMAQLLDERDLGVLKSLMNLFVALLANNHEAYSICLPECVKILERLARNQDVPQEYTYYGIPSPWLQVKTMRALQYFPTVEDPTTRRALFEVIYFIRKIKKSSHFT